MLCKQETHGDPRVCLGLGNAVRWIILIKKLKGALFLNNKFSDCAGEFFREALNRCGTELLDFSDCLEQDQRRRPQFCRSRQLTWDKCALAKLGIDKVSSLTWEFHIWTSEFRTTDFGVQGGLTITAHKWVHNVSEMGAYNTHQSLICSIHPWPDILYATFQFYRDMFYAIFLA